jgi:hypothetical protein
MARKLIPIISIVFISIIAIVFFIEANSIDRELFSETFIIDAVYFEEEQFVQISFLDKSGKTKTVILEILGMSESFQKSFVGSEFTEKVPFSSTPAYGWKTNPVTFVVEHEEYGKIGIKTEIHPIDEPSALNIFSKLD